MRTANPASDESRGASVVSSPSFHPGRVSTEDQFVGTLIESLIKRTDELGLVIPPGQLYSETDVSGRADSRPDFNRFREAIRARTVNVALMTKLDRIARSVRTALEFFEEAESPGIRIIVTEQAIDTETPAGRLTRTILAGISQVEGELIRERTQAALDTIRSGVRKTKSGNPIGRPRRVTPEPTSRVVKLRAEGLRWSDVAHRVGLPAETCRKAADQLKVS